MDTPDRNRIATPLSKFEDSPVFNYINNLSPIKPVKSMHVTQTFQSLSFVASIPSVFTSPHVSSHKESRFHRRLQSPDLSRPEFSPDNGDASKTSSGGSDAIPLPGNSSHLQERCGIGTSVEEFNVDPFHKRLKLAIKTPRILQYDCGSPKSNATASYSDIKTDAAMEMSVAPESLIQLVQDGLQEMTKHVQQNEAELLGMCQDEQSKEEVSGYDWENLISDATDQALVFESATDQLEAFRSADKKVDHDDNNFATRATSFLHDKNEDLCTVQSVGGLSSSYELCLQDTEIHPEEAKEQNDTDHTPQILPNTFQNKEEATDLGNKSGDYIPCGLKDEIQQQRGMRRRCLVFEMTGTKKKPLDEDSRSSSSNSVQSEGKFPSGHKLLVPFKPGTGSCILPSIGLHLNSLATTSKDCRIVKHEPLTSGSQLISMPNAASSFNSVAPGQKLLTNSSSKSIESNLSFVGNEVQVAEGAQQAPQVEVCEELNQISPKKKRCRLENAGESEGCKRCNCKKSKCLKLYCECFAAGVYCVEPCSCQDCFNKPIHEDTVLATRKQIESRNPLAFAPKVIRGSESVQENGEEGNNTPASARHKRGCNCKKSSCLKKYCECYQGGVGCSSNCRCEGCKNAFGRKDGYVPPVIEEAEPEEEDEAGEKDQQHGSLQTAEAQKDEKKHPDTGLAMTPIQSSRSSAKLPFFSGRKPPRCPLVTVASSSTLLSCETFRKSEFLHHRMKFEKKLQIISEDETQLDILKGSCSPPMSGGVKTTSPNRSKRVSPPHNEFRSSPAGQRGVRKLILQSIPPFPSLNHDSALFR